MSTLTNSPSNNTVLQLERRKSYSLAVWFRDHRGKPLDITGCTVRISAKKNSNSGNDNDNLLVNDVAKLIDPAIGYSRFDLQALDLDLPLGEFPFAVVLIDATGYSSVVLKGYLEVQDNPEADSLLSEYDSTSEPATAQVWMRDKAAIHVTFGYAMAPGSTNFMISDQEKLEQLNPLAQLPGGGFPGNFLARSGTAPYGTHWVAAPGGSGGGLDATGIPEGYLPTADGENTWNWSTPPETGVTEVNGETGDVTLTLGVNVPESPDAKTVTATEKTNIGNLKSAAYENTSAFRSAGPVPVADIAGILSKEKTQRVMGLRGIRYGTDLPFVGWTGPAETGDIYIQIES